MAWGRESSLEAAGALRAAAPSLGSIPNPPGGAGWSWRRCGCHRDPPVRPNSNSAEFCTLVVLNHSCYVMLVGLNWPLHPSQCPYLFGGGKKGVNNTNPCGIGKTLPGVYPTLDLWVQGPFKQNKPTKYYYSMIDKQWSSKFPVVPLIIAGQSPAIFHNY